MKPPQRVKSLRESARQETFVHQPEVVQQYFEFSFRDYNKAKVILTVPAHHMLLGTVVIRVTEPFVPDNYRIDIGTKEIPQSIGSAPIDVLGAQRVWIGSEISESDRFLYIFLEPEEIFMSITATAAAGTEATLGEGWGLLSMANMKLIPGYTEAGNG